MMFAHKLVRAIELHANELASRLMESVRKDPELAEYQMVPEGELKDRVYEIYRHLGNWLLGKDTREIQRRYLIIGGRRAAQGVPLSQLIRAINLTRDNLWTFLKKDTLIDRPIEIFGELELLQLLDQFFEQAVYYAALGYEEMSMTGKNQEAEQTELAETART
jgi:hypothetical protein